jgi:hypothetical protein
MRTDGQTDRHEKANIRFSQFFESAYKNINMLREQNIDCIEPEGICGNH